MSSTNRSDARNSHISDYYITPIEHIELFCEHLIKDVGNIFEGKRVLDPCAGGDEVNPMSYPEVIKKYNPTIIGTIDIREDSGAVDVCDYLEEILYFDPDVIITNPSFNIAMNVIEKALNDVVPNGYVIMLLRLNFFGSKRRFNFWQKYMPKYCYIHHERMSFTDNGKTDSIEYCHMVWKKGDYPEFTKIKVI